LSTAIGIVSGIFKGEIAEFVRLNDDHQRRTSVVTDAVCTCATLQEQPEDVG
jgi:hypothetical protein